MAHFFPTTQTGKKSVSFLPLKLLDLLVRCVFFFFKLLNVTVSQPENHSQMVTIEEIVSGNTAKPLIYFGEQ